MVQSNILFYFDQTFQFCFLENNIQALQISLTIICGHYFWYQQTFFCVTVFTVQVYTVHMYSKSVQACMAGSLKAKVF